MLTSNMPLNNGMRGLLRALPEFKPYLEAGYNTARNMRFSTFGCEHLLHALSGHEALAGLIRSTGGDASVMRDSLMDAFEEHASINGEPDRHPVVCDAMMALSMRVEGYYDDHPGIDRSEVVREALIGLIETVDGSMIAETALLDANAANLLKDSTDTGFFESEFDYMELPHAQAEIATGTAPTPPTKEQRKIAGLLDEAEDLGQGMLGDLFPTATESKADVKPAATAPRSAPPVVRSKTTTANQKTDEAAQAVEAALRDLSQDAGLGRIDPVLGRDEEIETILSILRRRRKGSVLIHGEAGVGKTAIAEGVAMRLRQPDIEPELMRRPYYELSMSDIVAGTKYRGDFEARMKILIDRMSEERAIIFVDEFHMLVGSGSTDGRGMDGANLLKPALARGEITIIGATTPAEMRRIRQDAALMRRFEPLPILEQSRSQTEVIMERACLPYLDHHRLRIEPDVISEICRITDLYQPERRFPDKAFDLLDAACVKAVEERAGRAEDERQGTLKAGHVRLAADRMGLRRPGRPDKRLATRLSALREMVSQDVIGQDEAVKRLCDATISAALNLDDSGVRGSFLVTGPEGSGKGLLPKIFARHMGLPFVRIDMQACQGRAGPSQLVGVAGPHGPERPGLLVEAGDAHRDMVLMLDEVDRADSSVQDLIASLIESGTFRASDGRVVSLRGAWVFITTSSAPIGTLGLGFGSKDSDEEDRSARGLPTGITSNLTARLGLKRPDQESLRDIVRIGLDDLVEKFRDFDVEITISGEVAPRLALDCKTAKQASAVAGERISGIFARAILGAEEGGVMRLIFPEGEAEPRFDRDVALGP